MIRLYFIAQSSNELYNNIYMDLNALSDWLKDNKLSLNVSKTNYMTFSNSKIEINPEVLRIGNETVEKTCTAKF